MSLTRNHLRRSIAALVAIFALSFAVVAKDKAQAQFPNINIKNFGQMDARFFRGAQPKPEDYKDLAALGIHTVIDLRDDPTTYEKSAVESLGMNYVNIAVEDKHAPQEAQIAEFLKLANDPATGKFFVHCAGGRHRTGIMGAVYRFNFYGWNYDQAYAEMKQYDFYTSWGHGDQLKYVQSYWQGIQSGQTHVAVASTATTEAVAASAAAIHQQ
ncbi:MAG: tyrosine-protein phosphatase [Acidobacteriota bacterium]|nr:tyrosine-protein phosphatase [Acidobacteriota bacterium]